MKKLVFLFLTFSINLLQANAQLDTASIGIIYKTVKNYYDKNDSIRWYAAQILINSKRLGYQTGEFYSKRLMGIAAQNEENNHKAIEYYLDALSFAEQRMGKQEQATILTDIGSSYVTLQQYSLAIIHYTKALNMAQALVDLKLQSICYNNLGACYRHLKKYSDAINMYQKAASIKTAIKDKKGLVTARNNIGSLYIFTNKPEEALRYFKQNLYYDLSYGTDNDLYFDYINIGAAYDATGERKTAKLNYDSALVIAKRLQNKEKESACYEQLAGFFKKQQDWIKAYNYIEKYQITYKAFIDEKNILNIAEMQEKYHAAAREKDNQLLAASLHENKLQKSNYAIASLAILMVAIAIAVAFFQNKKAKKVLEEQHKLSQKQNKKLNELNAEKNSLISIVSHDLAAPFSAIKTWNNLICSDIDKMSDEQVMAVAKIKTATQQGLTLIKRILDVDKIEMGGNQLQIETTDITVLVKQQIDACIHAASEKQITLNFSAPDKNSCIETDRQILERIIDNLLSNAIKFSPCEKNIWVNINCTYKNIVISIKDEGPGISIEELPHIFTRYSSISNKPLGNEVSNGLGLSIVKKLADEINATVHVESELNAGCIFYVMLPL